MTMPTTTMTIKATFVAMMTMHIFPTTTPTSSSVHLHRRPSLPAGAAAFFFAAPCAPDVCTRTCRRWAQRGRSAGMLKIARAHARRCVFAAFVGGMMCFASIWRIEVAGRAAAGGRCGDAAQCCRWLMPPPSSHPAWEPAVVSADQSRQVEPPVHFRLQPPARY